MKPTMLLADGDPELCDLYQQLLAQRGYDVETTLDGLDCLSKLRRSPPAVLLLDLELLWGGADGILDWIREEGPCQAMLVILTATAGHARARDERNEPPVVSYLPKPFALTELLDSVRSALSRRGRWERESLHGVATPAELFIG